MQMRFRTDGWHYADLKAGGWVFDGEGEKSYGACFTDPREREEAKECWDETPKAEPGDVWRVQWHGGAIAGYAICCPGCGHVHVWCTARNCSQKVPRSYVDTKTGETVHYESCVHNGTGSCWAWSGSAEEGRLTASPSLQVLEHELKPGGCNWHGWIQNGDIHN